MSDLIACLSARLPQWSPPLNGGSTCRSDREGASISSPQWSPPLNGGSTARIFGPSDLRKRAAMRAVRESAAIGPAQWTCQGAKTPADLRASAPRCLVTTSALAIKR